MIRSHFRRPSPRVCARRRLLASALLLAGVAAGVPPFDRPIGAQSAVDRAFDLFWRADSPDAAAAAVPAIVDSKVSFDEAWARLAKGRPYTKAPTGSLAWPTPVEGGAPLENVVEIPAEYEPAKRWPVRVQLHGGVARPSQASPSRSAVNEAPVAGGERPNRIRGEAQIYVHPSGYAAAQWWEDVQLANIRGLIDRLKRNYNVDERQVYLTGISDGGSAAYYLAMREPTVWSAILPLIGSIRVLGNADVRGRNEIFPNNLVNKPFFAVNGGKDPLYPAARVQESVDDLVRLGVAFDYRIEPESRHETSWWPSQRAAFEGFVHAHPREPHPAKLSWETERTDRFNRVHWLVVEEIGTVRGDGQFVEEELFPRRFPSARVDAVRTGNSVAVQTRGARAFTLLLSRDAVDFSQPITVTVNGRPAFTGSAREELATLLKWAARDNDRTMLYGAELRCAAGATDAPAITCAF